MNDFIKGFAKAAARQGISAKHAEAFYKLAFASSGRGGSQGLTSFGKSSPRPQAPMGDMGMDISNAMGMEQPPQAAPKPVAPAPVKPIHTQASSSQQVMQNGPGGPPPAPKQELGSAQQGIKAVEQMGQQPQAPQSVMPQFNRPQPQSDEFRGNANRELESYMAMKNDRPMDDNEGEWMGQQAQQYPNSSLFQEIQPLLQQRQQEMQMERMKQQLQQILQQRPTTPYQGAIYQQGAERTPENYTPEYQAYDQSREAGLATRNTPNLQQLLAYQRPKRVDPVEEWNRKAQAWEYYRNNHGY